MAQPGEHVGMNRTGVRMSPLDTGAMLDSENAPIRGTPGDTRELLDAREAYIAESVADHGGIGSVPLPGTLGGAVGMAVHMLAGDHPQVLLDKLGERLAFERTSTRLYDALLAKCDVMLDGHDGPAAAPPAITRAHVEAIRRDEAAHFLLLREAIEGLGGDATSQTPSADVTGVEAGGLLQVLYDPRTSLAQSLHALLTAELADHAGWETLIALAQAGGQDALAARFGAALAEESRHLALVHAWYEAALGLPPAVAAPATMPPDASAALPPDASTAPTVSPDVTAPGATGNAFRDGI